MGLELKILIFLPSLSVPRIRIVIIGGEILNGRTLDSNSGWLCRNLHTMGLRAVEVLVVPDDKVRITSALKSCWDNSDLVFVSGGLGSTPDDITKEVVADFFGTGLVYNPSHARELGRRYDKTEAFIQKSYRKQLFYPAACTLIPNEYGSALGMMFEDDKRAMICLPGVPCEFKGMLRDSVFEKIVKTWAPDPPLSIVLRTAGIPETTLNEKLERLERESRSRVTLSFLPGPGKVDLQITANIGSGVTKTEFEIIIGSFREELGSIVYGQNQQKLEEVVIGLLQERELSVATAESCTGGHVAHLMTTVPGVSSCFMGCVVAYSMRAKKDVLGVAENVLEKNGEISKETVTAMAKNTLNVFNCDLALATSGVMGPAKSEGKRIGTLWIGIAGMGKTVAVKKLVTTSDREMNIAKSSVLALDTLRHFILSVIPG